jgi:hypothetical protein
MAPELLLVIAIDPRVATLLEVSTFIESEDSPTLLELSLMPAPSPEPVSCERLSEGRADLAEAEDDIEFGIEPKDGERSMALAGAPPKERVDHPSLRRASKLGEICDWTISRSQDRGSSQTMT